MVKITYVISFRYYISGNTIPRTVVAYQSRATVPGLVAADVCTVFGSLPRSLNPGHGTLLNQPHTQSIVGSMNAKVGAHLITGSQVQMRVQLYSERCPG